MRNSESACPSQSQVSAVASSRGAGSPYALFRHRGESMLLEVQLEDCLVSRSAILPDANDWAIQQDRTAGQHFVSSACRQQSAWVSC